MRNIRVNTKCLWTHAGQKLYFSFIFIYLYAIYRRSNSAYIGMKRERELRRRVFRRIVFSPIIYKRSTFFRINVYKPAEFRIALRSHARDQKCENRPNGCDFQNSR